MRKRPGAPEKIDQNAECDDRRKDAQEERRRRAAQFLQLSGFEELWADYD